jgi:predicted ATP-grasp superfamily ATP-dependent carboligase
MRVLVTNADYHNGLAAVRSLGRKGVEVIAGSQTRFSQSFYSKYVSERAVYPSVAKEEEFVDYIRDLCKDRKIEIVLPIGYDATTTISKHIAKFEGVTKVPVANWESMQVAADKAKSLALADKLGVSVPKSYKTVDEVDSFPVVVKGIQSSGRIRYVNSRKELEGADVSASVIQEYIPGEGYGFFALYNKGQLRASFMHRRLREYPITGGPSIAAESVRDKELEASGLKLLNALRWHGVVMAEFKKDSRDGRFKLMEVNPKFWGSLELAIRSGVDFPYLTAKMAAEGDVQPVPDYKVGVKFKWIFPNEILYAMSRPGSIPTLIGECFEKDFDKDISLDDFGPNLFQMLATVRTIANRMGRGSVRYPHGAPEGRR